MLVDVPELLAKLNNFLVALPVLLLLLAPLFCLFLLQQTLLSFCLLDQLLLKIELLVHLDHEVLFLLFQLSFNNLIDHGRLLVVELELTSN